MVLDILDAGNDVEAVWAAGQRVQTPPKEDGAHRLQGKLVQDRPHGYTAFRL
jgi:hypothetical protein